MRNATLLFLTAVLAGVPLLAQMDPSGEWAPQFDEDFLERIPGPDIGDYLGLPVNNAARRGARGLRVAMENCNRTLCTEVGPLVGQVPGPTSTPGQIIQWQDAVEVYIAFGCRSTN